MTQSNPFEISHTAKQPTATETAPPSTGPVWHQYILLPRTMFHRWGRLLERHCFYKVSLSEMILLITDLSSKDCGDFLCAIASSLCACVGSLQVLLPPPTDMHLGAR